jgi:hypothetical protein
MSETQALRWCVYGYFFGRKIWIFFTATIVLVDALQFPNYTVCFASVWWQSSASSYRDIHIRHWQSLTDSVFSTVFLFLTSPVSDDASFTGPFYLIFIFMAHQTAVILSEKRFPDDTQPILRTH